MAFDGDPFGGLLVILVYVAIAAFVVIRAFGWNYVRGLMASGWSMTQGRVEFGSIELRRARYITYYVARIDYSYTVNNEYHSGFFEKTYTGGSAAERFVESMKGQMVFVRSHPNRPEKSVLLKQDQPGGWPA